MRWDGALETIRTRAQIVPAEPRRSEIMVRLGGSDEPRFAVQALARSDSDSRNSQIIESAAPSSAAARVADAMIKEPKTFPASATVGDIARFFQDDHVHAALLVEANRLVAVVERRDLLPLRTERELATTIGQLDGRVVSPDACIDDVLEEMQRTARRRLAVIDPEGVLLGLLCLKNSGRGFCSEADVRARQADRRAD